MDTSLREELARLYARVDAAVAARAPRCELSGRCCDFPRSGHRLYATDLESRYALAAAADALHAAPAAPALPAVPGTAAWPAAGSGLCPWHVEGLCRNRQGRPLGCRVYFCDPAYADEMPMLYERFHAELRELHAARGLDYRYAPFVDAVHA